MREETAYHATPGSSSPYRGFVDGVRKRTIFGWACDQTHLVTSVIVEVFVNEERAGCTVANLFRSDLEVAGVGKGYHGFEFAIPEHIHKVTSIVVYVANTSCQLSSGPIDMESIILHDRMFPSEVMTLDSGNELLSSEFLKRLITRAAAKACQYQANKPFPSIYLDDFLPTNTLESALRDFPDPKQIDWLKFDDTYTEGKLAFYTVEELPSSLRTILYFLNSRPILEFLERLTGMQGLIPDPYFFGGGLHQIESGGKLDIHADFNRHHKLGLHRRLNLMLYVNKDWKEEYGGHLELWNRDMTAAEAKILPVFNRCAIFSTSELSYHGHPEPLRCPVGVTRKSLATYYYTHERPVEEIVEPHSTLWKKRPG
jgi:Rps23 Pro-64 3,4-dihydroxylase Tpa1-like proline 4-hydroxylase